MPIEWTTTSDVPRECWRRLLEYANLDFAEGAILALHPDIPVGQRQNVRKQARHLRVALLQAREYFLSASHSSLFTSPNHLYYSMMSLASAAMLVHGNGTNSYDYLRRSASNRSHGLRFTTGVTDISALRGLTLLDDSRVEILPTGHFANWYKTVPGAEYSAAVISRHQGSGTSKHYDVIGSDSKVPLARLVGSNAVLLERVRRLPDLASDLRRAGIDPHSSRISHEVTIAQNEVHHNWRIHGASSSEALEALLEQFRFESGLVERVTYDFFDLGGSVTLALPASFTVQFQWPTSRERLDNEWIAYSEDVDTHEFADWYIAAFGLSMLARYFPDLWMAAIDAHGKTSKIVEAFVSTGLAKIPLLALRLLAGPITVSSQKPHWYG